MRVGVWRVRLRLPGNRSLKGKRQVLRSIMGRVRSRFDVAIAEVEDQDLWQIGTLGVAYVANEVAHVNEVLSKVMAYIGEVARDVGAEVIDQELELLSAF